MNKAKIGDVCDILDSQRIPITAHERVKGIYPYYGANGVQDYVNDYIFDDELVLVAEDGGYFGSKTKPIAYRVSGKCWVNNHAHVLKPKLGLDVDYLGYSLMFCDVSKIVSGATRLKLTQSALRKIEIPLPLLAEQKRIAAALDKMSSVIAKRKRQIALLDEAAKSLFVEMFGDPVENPMGWVVKQINSFSTVKIGPFGSALHQHDYIVGGHPLINPKHISNGTIYPDLEITVDDEKYHILDAYALSRGDVIVGRRGDIGRCAVVNEDGYICGTGSLFIRILDSCNSIYLKSVIEHPKMRKRLEDSSVGVTMKNLNAKIVSSFNIPLPPLDLQNLFAARIEALEAQRASCERGLKQMETAFAAMMQEYFG